MMYSFKINYRVRPQSLREQKLLEIAKEYGVQPGCHLIDRMVDDFHEILLFRSEQATEALRMQEEANKKLRRLKIGGSGNE
jgi:hypothetical protein